MKVGDIIWQNRMPGGWCLVLDIIEVGGKNDKRVGRRRLSDLQGDSPS